MYGSQTFRQIKIPKRNLEAFMRVSSKASIEMTNETKYSVLAPLPCNIYGAAKDMVKPTIIIIAQKTLACLLDCFGLVTVTNANNMNDAKPRNVAIDRPASI